MGLTIRKYCTITAGEGVQGGRASVDGREVFRTADGSPREVLSALYRRLDMQYPKFFKMDMLSKAGVLGAELLLGGGPQDGKTALVLANRNSSLDADTAYQATIGEEYFPSPAVFVYTLPNIVMGEICIRHRIYGENIFLVMPEFDFDRIFGYISDSFAAGVFERAVAGWTECRADKCDVFMMLVETSAGEDTFNIDIIKNISKNGTIDQ